MGADVVLTNGAILSGITVAVGYLLVFPFWIIHKFNRIITRLRGIQNDFDEQDDQIQTIERRLEVMNEDIESRRKEIVETIQLREK